MEKKSGRMYRVAIWTLTIVALLLFLNFGAKVALYNLALYRSYQVTKTFMALRTAFGTLKSSTNSCRAGRFWMRRLTYRIFTTAFFICPR